MSTAHGLGRLQLARDEHHRRHGVLAGYLPELVAMQHGLRPALQLAVPDQAALEATWPQVHRRAESSGLHVSKRAEGRGFRIVVSRRHLGDYPYARPRGPAWLGAYARGLTRAIRAGRPGHARERLVDLLRSDGERHGRLFGYPDCCVQAREQRKDRPAFVDDLRGLLHGSPTYPFELNPFLRTTPFHLYKHVPCSLRCAASLAANRGLLALLRREDPTLAGQICDFCRLPVLFTDICGTGIVLDGSASGDRITYGGIHVQGHPGPLLPMSAHNLPRDQQLFDELLDLLGQGDEVECRDRRIRVCHGGVEVGQLAAPSHLDWRILRFK